MATHLSITLPVFKKDKWEQFHKDGKLEVSSDVDNLSEGYQDLKKQLDKLLAELDAQSRLAVNAEALEREIKQKTNILKHLVKDIELATEHYESLKLFLKTFGIDPNHRQLTFDKQLLLNEASVAEVNVFPQSEF